MRINRHFYAPAMAIMPAEKPSVPLAERRPLTVSSSVGESESDDVSNPWSAWIDLGGEG
jgi:hypothetical protein